MKKHHIYVSNFPCMAIVDGVCEWNCTHYNNSLTWKIKHVINLYERPYYSTQKINK